MVKEVVEEKKHTHTHISQSFARPPSTKSRNETFVFATGLGVRRTRSDGRVVVPPNLPRAKKKFKERSNIFEEQAFSTALLSSLSHQPFSAAYLSSPSQHPFSAALFSSFSQQLSAALLSRFSQQLFSAAISS